MNFDEHDVALLLNAINFVFIMYNFYLYRKVNASLRIKTKSTQVQLPKDPGNDIQNNLGRRLLEIQQGRYAKPYISFKKESEDE